MAIVVGNHNQGRKKKAVSLTCFASHFSEDMQTPTYLDSSFIILLLMNMCVPKPGGCHEHDDFDLNILRSLHKLQVEGGTMLRWQRRFLQLL